MATIKAETTKALVAEARGLRIEVEAKEDEAGTFVLDEELTVRFLDEEGQPDGTPVRFPTADLERASALLAQIRKEELSDYRSEVCADHGRFTPDRANDFRCPECHPAKLAAVPAATPAV